MIQESTNFAGWTGEVPAESHKLYDVGSIPTPVISYLKVKLTSLTIKCNMENRCSGLY